MIRTAVLVLTTVLLCGSDNALAQATDTIRRTEGEQIVVQADRAITVASERSYLESRFALKPRNSTQDLIRVVPGLFLAQHAGGGKAEQIFLRGFDADHGTDVNITVDGAPVNMVSHGHGQGYADLHFIIPETIERIDVAKGPYLASYGDLMTAGAIALRTRDSIDRNMVRIEAGSFDRYRAVGLMSLPLNLNGVTSYAAGELVRMRGYFDSPQDFERWNILGKVSAQTSVGQFTAGLMSFGSTWNASGQIPLRAIGSGAIDRFGAINDLEGGNTARTTATLSYKGEGIDPLSARASYSHYDFQLFSDFTFFARDSVRGDMIEQRDDRRILNARIEKPFTWSIGNELPLLTRVGLDLRYDDISLGLYHDSARARYATVSDAEIHQAQVGAFVEQQVLFGWSTLYLGARADRIGFSVLERTDAPSGRRHAEQYVVSPKASMIIPVDTRSSLFLNSGFGFHSNDARAVVLASDRSLARAFGSELGLRYADMNNVVILSGALWMLDLEEELVYVGDEGTTESSGRTRRLGIDLELTWKPLEWLTWNGELTLARGRFRDAPVGEDHIPLAPERTFTSTLTIEKNAFAASLDMRTITDRPANEAASVTAYGYTVLDISAQYRFSNVILHAGMDNVFDVEWNEAQFDTESRLSHEATPISELHIIPGTPRSLRLGIGYEF